MIAHWIMVTMAKVRVRVRALRVQQRRKAWSGAVGAGNYAAWELVCYGDSLDPLDLDECILDELASFLRKHYSVSATLMPPHDDFSYWMLAVVAGKIKVGISWHPVHGFCMANEESPPSVFKSPRLAFRYIASVFDKKVPS